MKRQFITLILALILGVTTAQADIIKGRVVDADTGEPLQGAEVVFKEESLDMNSVIRSTIRTDSVGRFQHACKMAHQKEHKGTAESPFNSPKRTRNTPFGMQF